MKAKLFAVVLSLFVVTLPVQSAVKSPSAEAAAKTVQAANKINLNKADVQELTHSVPGIGSKRAEAIVSYREAHGVFKSVEDLAAVKGLGKQFVKNHLAQLQEKFAIE